MKTLSILAGAFAVTLVAASAAQASHGPPAIADYLNRTPTVLGSVTASDDHSVTLATDSGSPMNFVIDSRSVVPADLPGGMRVRVEFRALSADVFHAGRITPLTAAEIRELEEHAAPRMRAGGEVGNGSEAAITTDTEPGSWSSTGGASTSAVEDRPADVPAPQGTAPADETAASDREVAPEAVPPASEAPSNASETGELPRTAGTLPLVGVVSAVALVAAVGIGLLRRRRV